MLLAHVWRNVPSLLMLLTLLTLLTVLQVLFKLMNKSGSSNILESVMTGRVFSFYSSWLDNFYLYSHMTQQIVFLLQTSRVSFGQQSWGHIYIVNFHFRLVESTKTLLLRVLVQRIIFFALGIYSFHNNCFN